MSKRTPIPIVVKCFEPPTSYSSTSSTQQYISLDNIHVDEAHNTITITAPSNGPDESSSTNLEFLSTSDSSSSYTTFSFKHVYPASKPFTFLPDHFEDAIHRSILGHHSSIVTYGPDALLGEQLLFGNILHMTPAMFENNKFASKDHEESKEQLDFIQIDPSTTTKSLLYTVLSRLFAILSSVPIGAPQANQNNPQPHSFISLQTFFCYDNIIVDCLNPDHVFTDDFEKIRQWNQTSFSNYHLNTNTTSSPTSKTVPTAHSDLWQNFVEYEIHSMNEFFLFAKQLHFVHSYFSSKFSSFLHSVPQIFVSISVESALIAQPSSMTSRKYLVNPNQTAVSNITKGRLTFISTSSNEDKHNKNIKILHSLLSWHKNNVANTTDDNNVYTWFEKSFLTSLLHHFIDANCETTIIACVPTYATILDNVINTVSGTRGIDVGNDATGHKAAQDKYFQLSKVQALFSAYSTLSYAKYLESFTNDNNFVHKCLLEDSILTLREEIKVIRGKLVLQTNSIENLHEIDGNLLNKFQASIQRLNELKNKRWDKRHEIHQDKNSSRLERIVEVTENSSMYNPMFSSILSLQPTSISSNSQTNSSTSPSSSTPVSLDALKTNSQLGVFPSNSVNLQLSLKQLLNSFTKLKDHISNEEKTKLELLHKLKFRKRFKKDPTSQSSKSTEKMENLNDFSTKFQKALEDLVVEDKQKHARAEVSQEMDEKARKLNEEIEASNKRYTSLTQEKYQLEKKLRALMDSILSAEMNSLSSSAILDNPSHSFRFEDYLSLYEWKKHETESPETELVEKLNDKILQSEMAYLHSEEVNDKQLFMQFFGNTMANYRQLLQENGGASQETFEVDMANQFSTFLNEFCDRVHTRMEFSVDCQWEKDRHYQNIMEMKFRYESLLRYYQKSMFLSFRSYRNTLDEQREKMDLKYRSLVENAVKDALKLNEENQRLKMLLEKKSKAI